MNFKYGIIVCVANVATIMAGQPFFLSPAQTEGLAQFNGIEGAPISAISKANPTSRGKLRKMLKTPPPKANMGNIIRMLGYIGDKTDAKSIGVLVHTLVYENPEKKLTDGQKDLFYACTVAIGVMSHRGIPEAKQIAERLVEETPWIEFGKRRYGDEVLGRVPRAQYIAMDQFLKVYAVSQDPDLEKYRVILAAKAKGMTKEHLLILDPNPKVLGKIGEAYRVKEKKEPPKGFLADLAVATGQSPRVRKGAKADVPDVKIENERVSVTLAVDAIQAFERISKIIRDDTSAEMSEALKLRGSILDNGKPIRKKKWDRAGGELIEGMKVDRSILIELAKMKNVQHENFRVKIQAGYSLKSLPKESNNDTAAKDVTVTGQEDITVTFDIPNTAVMYKKHVPRVSDRRTSDKKRNLRVYMKRINGKWMWNPFGW